MRTPDATVVIAAWNARHVIRRAIASALSQQDVAVEVIVADDASTDDTRDVVAAFGDLRVRPITLAINGGPAAARNAAIEEGRGRWIAVLDADDFLLPGRLANLIAAGESAAADIVCDNMWVENAAGARRLFLDEALDSVLVPVTLAAYAQNNRLFGRGPSEGYLKPLFRTEFLRAHALHYESALRIGEDFLLVADALALGARALRHRSAGYVYTTQAGSISRRLSARDAEAMVAADRRFLARHQARLTADEREAMREHLRSLEEGAAFAGMVADMKGGDLLALARRIGRRPTAVRHFAMPIRARLERAGLIARA
jgi:succinoglycan biosynthesis protein ExoO